MRAAFSITLVLLVVLAVATDANKNHKGQKGKPGNVKPKPGSECAEWNFMKCVPETGDCGAGFRDKTCKDQTMKDQTMKEACKIPCNWKKDLNDCKYTFTNWSECNAVTGTKVGTATRNKKSANYVECQETREVSKPCSSKGSKKAKKEKKRNGN